jgi:hypothetical protein
MKNVSTFHSFCNDRAKSELLTSDVTIFRELANLIGFVLLFDGAI